MTNLKLPSLRYGQIKAGKLCYATEATVAHNDWAAIYHHSSLIATVEADSVYITTAGWDSRTTAMRIDRVLQDNDIPYRVAIRDGVTHLFRLSKHIDGKHVGWFDLGWINSAGFVKDADGWHLMHR